MGHTVQLEDVEFVWNVPALQLTQVPAAAPAYWPAGQLVQLVAPVVPTYKPTAQLEHTVDTEAPTEVEKVPAMHPWQVAKDEAPTVVE
jgi:hypothetical protein